MSERQSVPFEQLLGNVPDRVEKQFEPGQIVLRQGEKRGQLFVLRSGSVEIVKNGLQICTVAEAGAVFGELSALLNTYHNATVRAVEPSSFYVIDNPSDFLKQNSDLALYLAKLLARRLALLDSYFADLKAEFFSLAQNKDNQVQRSPDTELLSLFWAKAEKDIGQRWHGKAE
jgi:CRP/FNR family transcriptional regulator, cyclic AMP receptor protein